jgi:hypothetical protein
MNPAHFRLLTKVSGLIQKAVIPFPQWNSHTLLVLADSILFLKDKS